MSLAPRYSLPRSIERGKAATLTLDVYNAASVQQTATAGTFTLKAGDKTLFDGVALSVFGPPAEYSLAAAATADEALTDRLLEVWSLTIDGTARTFQRPAMLVRRAFYPTITDQDLLALYPDLNDLRRDEDTSWESFRERARQKIERELLKRGRRPHLIFDAWALVDAHVELTLHYLYSWAYKQLGGPRYKEAAAEHGENWKAEWSSVQFRYDEDETGTITTDDTIGGQSSIVLTAGPGWRPTVYR